MTAIAIVGAQWGDEGKGKVVDHYTERADVVVRYAGGPNPGHTLVVGEDKIVVRLLPSGVLRPRATCVLGQGMVVDLAVLAAEIDALAARGVDLVGRLALSTRAHVVLPHHLLVDGLREGAAVEGAKIGTTKRGIGPCYEDKAARRGLRVCDLADLARVERIVAAAVDAWAPTIVALGGAVPDAARVVADLAPLCARFTPLARDTSRLVDDAIVRGDNVLLEGAQGTLLDLDHGTYPFVTSSSAVAGGAAVGAGIGPTRIKRSVGITKGYATRVGAGPFPTELDDAIGERLRTVGGEFGSVTGRPRRTGWIDVCALRYAARVNGLDGLAVTKLDVLSGLDEVKACVAYDLADGERTEDFPIDALERAFGGGASIAARAGGALAPIAVGARPVLKSFAGWSAALGDAKRLEDLPKTTRAFLDFVAESTRTAIDVVSIGPRRDQTIVLRDPFA